MSADRAQQESYYYPNKISRILLLAMREIMGVNGLNAVLSTAKLQKLIDNYPQSNFEPGLTFDETGQLLEAVEGIYGLRGGRRLGAQVGQRCFKYGIEGLGGVIGFADFALRFVPVALRVRIVLEVLAEILTRYSDQRIVLGEDEHCYYFVADRCGLCWGRNAQEPVCSVMVGLLEESLYWGTRGRHFSVEEVTCIANGDQACAIRVVKMPLS